MKDILVWIWQLPQHLIGLIVRVVTRARRYQFMDGTVVYYWKTTAGLSLGDYIFINEDRHYWDTNYLKHEQGHQIQSVKLGWLYLFVIGIPSFIWASLYHFQCVRNRWDYYDFYTEKWANQLGGVER